MGPRSQKTATTLGDLISTLYDEFFAVYGDEDMTAVAVAATVNDWLGKCGIEAAPAPTAFGPRDEAAA
jgi:hypothetical protein